MANDHDMAPIAVVGWAQTPMLRRTRVDPAEGVLEASLILNWSDDGRRTHRCRRAIPPVA